MTFNFESVNFMDNIKLAYDSDKNTWQVLIGGGKTFEKQFDKKNDAEDKNWVQTYEEYRQIYQNAVNGTLSHEDITKENQKAGYFGQVSFYGYIELDASSGDLKILDGGIVLISSVGIEGSMPVPSAPMVYFSYGISGTLESSLNFELEKSEYLDSKIKVTGENKFTVEPYVGAGLGVRGALSFEIGLKGALEMVLSSPFEGFKKSFEASLTGDVYATLSILGYKWEYVHPFVKYNIYPERGFEPVALFGLDEDAQLVPRDYLNRPALMAYDETTLKSGIYPYTNVQTVTLSDGSVLMVYLDDNPNRSETDRTSLYYNVYKNGAWGEAKEINSDETADYGFTLASYNNKAAIIWQNAKTALSSKDDIYDIAKTIELCYSEFNGSAWSEPLVVTDNADYEYLPGLMMNYSNSYIAWVTNDKNNPVAGLDSEKESVHSATVTNKKVGAISTVMSDIPLISELAVGQSTVAVISDGKDLYVNGKKVYSGENELYYLTYYNGCYRFCDGSDIYQINEASPDNAVKLYSFNGENIKYIENNYGKAAVFEVQSGFTSELYASYFKSGSWTAPVQITDYQKKLRSWSAVPISGGELFVSAAVADISVESGDLEQYVSLVGANAVPMEDISLEDLTVEDIKRGSTGKFTLYIKNNTKASLRNVNITLTGENSGELYNMATSVSIAPGEIVPVTVNASIPENFEKQNVTANVSVSGLNETDSENNSLSAVAGLANLEVKLSGAGIRKRGTAKITVKNLGCEEAENVTVTLRNSMGLEIFSTVIENIAMGEGQTLTVDVPEEYKDFGEETYKIVYTAEAATDTEETVKYDNKDSYSLMKNEAVMLCVDNSNIGLAPGESVKPKISTNTGEEVKLYISSDNMAVAKVSEDGTITALSVGTATITYMSAEALNSVRITVSVREMGTPVITEIEYEDYGYAGYLNVSVDTTNCLTEYETANLIIAVYNNEGKLINVDQSLVDQGESYVSAYIKNDKPAKVKVMLWDSLQGMRPVAYSVEQGIKTFNLDINNVGLMPGQSIKPVITAYPPTDEELTFSAVSDDETVAVVGEDGTVTAISEGSATITYTVDDSCAPVRFTVHVREMGTPVVSARYDEYIGDGYNFKGIELNYDTTECFASNEEAEMIVAAYDENGEIIRVWLFDAYCERYEYRFGTGGIKPAKVKVLFWTDIERMIPTAYAVETEVE